MKKCISSFIDSSLLYVYSIFNLELDETNFKKKGESTHVQQEIPEKMYGSYSHSQHGNAHKYCIYGS